MNLITSVVVYTANVLGIFNDPFEFAGDYGPEMNPVRQRVFELVVSKEALAKNLTDSQIVVMMEKDQADASEIKAYRHILVNEALEADKNHGPVLSEVITSGLIEDLISKRKKLENVGFSRADLREIIYFINKYGDKKLFYFLRNNPQELMNLDKILRDNAARDGKPFDLPVLTSTQTLRGHDSDALKRDLLEALFTEEVMKVTRPEEVVRKAIDKLDDSYLERYFGEGASNRDLAVFCRPAGQLFFFWLYHSLNLHLVAQDEGMIDQINKVKEIFASTLGDKKVRAESLKEKLMAANASVLFTQESDNYVPEVLLEGGLFLPVDKQNPKDGTMVFLRSDVWEADYQVIPVEGYDGYARGVINLVLATNKETGVKFLLAAGHGHSIHAEDGRLQISLIMEQFQQLRQKYEGLQLLIGTDANTKKDEDVKALRELLETLGLTATSVGPTTVKQRMVTVQHAKAGRYAADEEDYLITLKTENGGAFSLTHPTVGFSEEKPDVTIPLPNLNNRSDHYPVGAVLN